MLRAINADGELTPLSEAQGDALWQTQQEEGGFADLETFLAHSVFGEKTMTNAASLLGESSSWFLLSAEVEVAERKMRLYSVLQRDKRDVRPIVRAMGSL